MDGWGLSAERRRGTTAIKLSRARRVDIVISPWCISSRQPGSFLSSTFFGKSALALESASRPLPRALSTPNEAAPACDVTKVITASG